MHIRIGSRGSRLALAQTEQVCEALRRHYPEHTYEVVVITTKGDRIADVALDRIGDKGLFVREIERALLENEIQLAVHSMKDMPSEETEGLVFAKCWRREDPRDALILREVSSLEELPAGAVIATGSKRRAAQLKCLRPDLQVVGIRGNVDTRLRKMEEQGLDGLVLAAAGLKRLHREECAARYLEPEEMVPACAQGALALQLRKDNELLRGMLDSLADEGTDRCVRAERCFLKETEAGCHAPVGAYCCPAEGEDGGTGELILRAVWGTEDEKRLEKVCLRGRDPEELGREAAEVLRKRLEEPRIEEPGMEESGMGEPGREEPGKEVPGMGEPGASDSEPAGCPGLVCLVGAGPGDEGLMTVKGREFLRKADCVVYDHLANESLLRETKPGCETVYVGKEGGHHNIVEQEEIQRILAEKAFQYPLVVRLKGGDPYVFGRGGEEGLYLRERGIPFLVVPGISSAIAGPALAGIPVTHRGLARGFRVVTAHTRDGGLTEQDFESLARTEDTCIFLMGLSRLEELAQGLLRAGKKPDTPVAVISHATLPEQRCVTAPLEKIGKETRKAGLTAPALIVVGEVVRLRQELGEPRDVRREPDGARVTRQETDEAWVTQREPDETGPVRQKPEKEAIPKEQVPSCLVTRVGNAPSPLAAFLEMRGIRTGQLQTGGIRIHPHAFDEVLLSSCVWIVLTSRNAVDAFFAVMKENRMDHRLLAGCRFAVVGKKTAACLASHGFYADLVPETATGDMLRQALMERAKPGERIFYGMPEKEEGEEAPDEIFDREFRERFSVVPVCLYKNEDEIEGMADIRAYRAVAFTCASSARRLWAHLSEEQRELLRKGEICAASIGPKTTEALEELGVRSIIQAETASYESLGEALAARL